MFISNSNSYSFLHVLAQVNRPEFIRQLRLETLDHLIEAHSTTEVLDYYNQHTIIPNRVTVMKAILLNPLGATTSAFLDANRQLVSRERYLQIITQPNIFENKRPLYVQQMLLREILRGASEDEIVEISRWAIEQPNDYLIKLKSSGLRLSQDMLDYALQCNRRHL